MVAFLKRRPHSTFALLLGSLGLTVLTGLPAAHAESLAPIWNGAYAGFHGGLKWSDVSTDFAPDFSATDVIGGAHIGYNFAYSGIVLGVEADANIDSTSFDYAFAGGIGNYETSWSGSLRARVGVPVGPALLYATAGYAWSQATISESNGAGAAFSADKTFDGIVYGIGAEAFLLPNMSLRLEALRYDYAAEDIAISGVHNALEEFDPSDTVVRAGVTFHLN